MLCTHARHRQNCGCPGLLHEPAPSRHPAWCTASWPGHLHHPAPSQLQATASCSASIIQVCTWQSVPPAAARSWVCGSCPPRPAALPVPPSAAATLSDQLACTAPRPRLPCAAVQALCDSRASRSKLFSAWSAGTGVSAKQDCPVVAVQALCDSHANGAGLACACRGAATAASFNCQHMAAHQLGGRMCNAGRSCAAHALMAVLPA